MKYWDSSAIMPLILQEGSTLQTTELLKSDADIITAWTTECKCYSAIQRLRREKALEAQDLDKALARYEFLLSSWHIVTPSDQLCLEVKRILRIHPLKSADAIQLASALLASNKNPIDLGFVSLDSKLIDAAKNEGFVIYPAR